MIPPKKTIANDEAKEFFRRYNQKQFAHQKLGIAFLKFFEFDCTHLDKMCARKVCSSDKAIYFNSSTRKYYCQPCAFKINHFNGEICKRVPEHVLFHARHDERAAKVIWENFVNLNQEI